MGALAKSARLQGGFDEETELVWATKASLQGGAQATDALIDDGRFDEVEVQQAIERSRQEYALQQAGQHEQPPSAAWVGSSDEPIVLD